MNTTQSHRRGSNSRSISLMFALFTAFMVSGTQAAPVSGQGTWETTLQGRDLDGNAATFEAYYDTTLDITWLADANATGTWATANTWAADLDVNGITGWRLPTNTPLNGSSYSTTFSNNGTTDRGTATTTTNGSDGGWRDGMGNPVSEMGHMFYVTLGNLGVCLPNGSGSSTSCDTQSGSGLSNTADFLNIQSAAGYWSGSEVSSGSGWLFSFNDGNQNILNKGVAQFAWAVHSGDVSAVPVPAAVWLFGSGLLAMLGFARRKTSTL